MIPFTLLLLHAAELVSPSVSVRTEVSCPSEAELRSALDRHLTAANGVVTDTAAPVTVTVTVTTPAPGHLHVEIRAGANTLSRELPTAGAKCADLAEAAALLAEAWLRENRLEEPKGIEVAPAAEGPADAGARLPPSTTASTPPPAAPAIPAPAPTPEKEPIQRSTTTPPLASGPRRIFHAPPIELRAQGLGEVGTFPGSFSGGAALWADVSLFPRLALGVSGAWLTDLAGQDAFGHVDVHRQRFLGFGRVRILSWLHVIVGAGDLVSEATGVSGPGGTVSQTSHDPLAVIGLQLRRELWGRLFGFGEALALADFSHSAYHLDEPQGPVVLATEPAFAMSLSLGLGLHIF